MKKIIGVLLFLVGASAGICIGKYCMAEAPQPAPVEVESNADELAAAKDRIAELEKELQLARQVRAEKVVEETDSGSLGDTNSVEITVGPDTDLETELKKHLSDEQYAAVTNAMETLRARLEERTKSKKDYLESLDVARLSKEDRDNHEKFMSLLAKKDALAEKMKGGFLGGSSLDASTLQEMAQVEFSLASAAKKERSILARELAREMGYTGDDVDVVHDAVVNIYDCTTQSGLEDITDEGGTIQVLPGFGMGTEVE